MLGLRFCARAFSSCGKWGPLFIVVRGPLAIAASLVAEHRLQTRRLSSCGSRAQLLCGMWNPPRPGLEPVSPALAGRLSTTAPLGKPLGFFFYTHHAAPFLSLDSGHPSRTPDEELRLLIKESDSRPSPVLLAPISKGQSSQASYFLRHLLPFKLLS